MKKIKFISAALFILIGGRNVLPVSAQMPGADVQIDPNTTGSTPVGPGAPMLTLPPVAGRDVAVKSQLPSSVVTPVIHRDAPILPESGRAFQAQSDGKILGGNARSSPLDNAAADGGRGRIATPLDASKSQHFESASVNPSHVRMKIRDLNPEGAGKIPQSDESIGIRFRQLYENEDTRHPQIASKSRIDAIVVGLPGLGPSPEAWLKLRDGMIAAVGPMHAVEHYQAEVIKVGLFLKNKQVTPAQAAAMIAHIKENARRRGIKEADGVREVAENTFYFAANAAYGDNERLARSGSQSLKLWNDLLSENGEPFVRDISMTLQAVDQMIHTALSRPDVIPQVPVVARDIIGSGSRATIALRMDSGRPLPSQVVSIPKDISISMEVGEAPQEDLGVSDAGRLMDRNIRTTPMPFGFAAAYRRYLEYRSEDKDVWTSFKMSFGRWMKGEQGNFWAAVRQFYYTLIRRFGADMPTIRLNSDPLRGRRSGLILQPA